MVLGLGLSLHAIGGGQSVFNPATLTLTGWWRTNYAGSPWTGIASAGASGGRTLEEPTNPPTTGSTINSLTPANFDGTNDRLEELDLFLSSYVSASAWWVGMLVNVDTVAAAAANAYDDEALVSDDNGGWLVAVNSSGVRAINYDGAFKTTGHAALSTGAWAWVEAWLSAGVLSVSVNGGTAATVGSVGNLTSPGTRVPRVGQNWDGTKFYDGRIAELMIAQSVPSSGDRASIRTSYLSSRYGLSL
jgi:hypothetical protein